MAWHAAGVLHLDLKPSNVAISADGDVVVLDAGISKCVTDGSVAVRGAVGTPGYMAPELRGDGSHVAVAACDVFSLGATYRRALDRWAKATRYSKRRAVRGVGNGRVWATVRVVVDADGVAGVLVFSIPQWCRSCETCAKPCVTLPLPSACHCPRCWPSSRLWHPYDTLAVRARKAARHLTRA